jgi:hypothetical protein
MQRLITCMGYTSSTELYACNRHVAATEVTHAPLQSRGTGGWDDKFGLLRRVPLRSLTVRARRQGYETSDPWEYTW